MGLQTFFSQHAVFSLEDLDQFLSKEGTGNLYTRKALLAYHRRQGRIIIIRRGLYAVIPIGFSPELFPVDPHLLTAKMTEDAVLAYHTALEFHGKAYSAHRILYYLSLQKSLPVRFRSNNIRRVAVPRSLHAKGREMFGVENYQRSGVELRVTSLERTLVDVLDRPDLAGGWEEIWRSLESVEFFDLDKVIQYSKFLGRATTAAKVGFFLEQHKENLMVEEKHFTSLRELRPRQPHYLSRSKQKNCKWVKKWNLMIPTEIINQSWAEII